MRALALFLLALWLGAGAGKAATLCTLIVDAQSADVLFEEGACDQGMTPASTFKLPLAVIGFDTGILESPDLPKLSYEAGDPDWGGANWTRDTTPRDWLRYSVVWYSQRITRALGDEVLTQYLQELGFGNADISGDAGQQNGLERAWLSSSLSVTPNEQAEFLCGLVTGTLPVSKEAMTLTRKMIAVRLNAGWRMRGKTGGAYPRGADGSFDYARGVGWYVGWATKGRGTLVFVRLSQADMRQDKSPGIITREAVEQDWPTLMARLGL